MNLQCPDGLPHRYLRVIPYRAGMPFAGESRSVEDIHAIIDAVLIFWAHGADEFRWFCGCGFEVATNWQGEAIEVRRS